MLQFFFSSCRFGFRSRGFFAIFLLGVALIGIAYLAASFSPRQPRTVALDVGFSGLRFSLVLFALTLVQDLVGKEIDRRAIVISLSYPVPRSAYLLGRYLGVLALTAVATALLAILLAASVFAAGLHYDEQFPVSLGLAYWGAVAGVWLDVAVVAAFALWIASLSTVSMLPLTLGALFAIAGKSLGAVVDYLARGADGDAELVGRFSGVIEKISWVLPDLSRLDWRPWPMYGLALDGLSVILSVTMAVAYIALMLGLAVMTLSRREFS